MRPPITPADRVTQALLLLAAAGVVFGVGRTVLHAAGRSSPARRRHGWYVLGWMVGGCLVGGAVGVCVIDNVRYYPGEADVGMAGFGLLLGWLVGMIHGGVALALRPG